ncbi:DUF397 domain-containing protein [Actinophytocola sediminis]
MPENIHATGWRKSSFSSADSDNCVEVRIAGHSVGVRDSKNADGLNFWVNTATWNNFLVAVRDDAALTASDRRSDA